VSLGVADLALLGFGWGEAGAGGVGEGVTVTTGGSLDGGGGGGWGLGLLHVDFSGLLLCGVWALEVVGAVVSDVTWTTTEGAGLTCCFLVDKVLQFEGSVDAVWWGGLPPEIIQLAAVSLLVDELHTPVATPDGEWTEFAVGGGLPEVGDEEVEVAKRGIEVRTVGGGRLDVRATGEATDLGGGVAVGVPANVHRGVQHVRTSSCLYPMAVDVTEGLYEGCSRGGGAKQRLITLEMGFDSKCSQAAVEC
jgi:hypothetical protein